MAENKTLQWLKLYALEAKVLMEKHPKTQYGSLKDHN